MTRQKAPPKDSTTDPGSLRAATEDEWRVYSVINEWIRFADTKAGILLAANGALAAAAVSAAQGPRHVFSDLWVAVPSIIGGIGLIVSSIWCLICILPDTSSSTDGSLIYFQHIAARASPDQYVEAAKKRLEKDDEAFNEISRQVWANARVARDKYRQVRRAVLALAVTWLCALIAALFSIEAAWAHALRLPLWAVRALVLALLCALAAAVLRVLLRGSR